MLEVKNLSFSYKRDKQVLNSISFSIKQGEMLALIGESGSGKSTILKLIYGLEQWYQGEIIYNGKPLKGPKYRLVPGEPSFKYLSQDFDLMPYTTVADNVGKYLSNNLDKSLKIEGLLELVDMADFADVKAKDLSGGQKQRIALARAIAEVPDVLILDEPFSQIDAFKKNYLKRGIFEYAKDKNMTVILATHEVDDALSYADKVLAIKGGSVIEVNTPEKIYSNPKNEYVASLFGEVNVFDIDTVTDVIPENEFKKIIIYPNLLKVDENGEFEVFVIKSYYVGHSYMIEASYDYQRVFFYHFEKLEEDDTVNLKIASFIAIDEE